MYLVYESLYGDLLNECDSTWIVGLYKNKDDAIKKAKELIQEDIKLNNYVLDEENNNINNGYARLFWNKQENWGCYYEIIIKKMEVK